MNTTPVKSPKANGEEIAVTPVVESAIMDASSATITRQHEALIVIADLEVGLRRWTLLSKRYFHQLIRVVSVAGRIDELASELGYPLQLVDDELLDFIYHSCRVSCAVGVEYADYSDDWETIKRKFAAYIAVPSIDDLWNEINKAINNLDHNPDPVTAPGVDTQKLDPKPE